MKEGPKRRGQFTDISILPQTLTGSNRQSLQRKPTLGTKKWSALTWAREISSRDFFLLLLKVFYTHPSRV
jgi:hypothetical protein